MEKTKLPFLDTNLQTSVAEKANKDDIKIDGTKKNTEKADNEQKKKKEEDLNKDIYTDIRSIKNSLEAKLKNGGKYFLNPIL